MPPLTHDSGSRLEAGQSKDFREKSISDHVYGDTSLRRTGRTDHNRSPTERMPTSGRLLVMLSLSFLVAFGVATAALAPRDWHLRPCQNGDVVRKGGAAPEDRGSLTSLLDKASPNSLHELLHKYFPERFKDGVWESDVTAVEAVRRADPALAASIVQLARRQADNATSTTEPPPPDSTTPPPPPDSTTSEPPPPDSTTSPPPDDDTSTTTPPSTSPPPTTTPPSSNTGRTSTTTTPRTSSTTGPPSSTTRTTTDRTTTFPGTSSSTDSTKPSSPSPRTSSTTNGSGLDTASRSGAISTSTSRGGTSNTITNRPGPSTTPTLRPITSTFTSTDAGGGVVVVTTTTWVSADPVQSGPTSSRPSPTLQNAAGPGLQQNRYAQVVTLLGVVVGAVLLV